MPVSFVNRVDSARSRWCPPPTESPTNVIDCPPYFAFMAFAFGTGGAFRVAAALDGDCFAADAMLSDTINAATAASAAITNSGRCFMGIPSSFSVLAGPIVSRTGALAKGGSPVSCMFDGPGGVPPDRQDGPSGLPRPAVGGAARGVAIGTAGQADSRHRRG